MTLQEICEEIYGLDNVAVKENQKMEELQKSKGIILMNEENKPLSIRENDVLAVNFLKQNLNSVLSTFSKDVFLLHTMINEEMYVEEIHEKVICLQKGDRVQLILAPQNKYNEKAIIVKNETGQRLGCIPKVRNDALYYIMDSGKFLVGIVCGGDIGEKMDSNNKWIKICIDVYILEE